MTRRDHSRSDDWLLRTWCHVAAVGAGDLVGTIVALVIGWGAHLAGWLATAAAMVISAAWTTGAALGVIVVGAAGMFVCSLRQVRSREQDAGR